MKELLEKYAEVARQILVRSKGSFTVDEQFKVADLLIQRDIRLQKEAALEDYGVIVAHSFYDELSKLAVSSQTFSNFLSKLKEGVAPTLTKAKTLAAKHPVLVTAGGGALAGSLIGGMMSSRRN